MLSFRTEKQSGFTLLEVLVAIMIFSLLTITSSTILSLVRNNVQQQATFTKDFALRQYAISLLMNDLLHAEMSDKYPLKIAQSSENCSSQILFFTRNLPNINSQYADPLLQVAWRFSADGVTRTTTLSSEHMSMKKLFSQAKCFDFRIFKNKQWKHTETLKAMPQAISFNLVLSDQYNIERFIPMFHDDTR
jgi:general secretion pathway protein J